MAKGSVNYNEFEQNNRELEIIFNRMNQTLDDINTNCSSIVSSEIWNGKAADYYMMKSKDVCDNYSDINYALKIITVFLNSKIDAYKNFEKNIMKK